MATGTLTTATTVDLLLSGPSRRCAQAAAGLTVVGAVSLGTFFAVGGAWGAINDVSNIALAAATIPIAVGLARRNPGALALTLGAGADIVGAFTTSAFTVLLLARRMTFEESLSGVMVGQGLIGCWLLLMGLTAWSDPGSRRLAALAITAGTGFVAASAGVMASGMSSPLAVGWLAALVGTLGSYSILGWRKRR